MKKLKILNRKGQSIVIVIEKPNNPNGLAFIMHGLSGNKEQPHIVAFAEAFEDRGFIVIRFDTTNTFGESEGRYENATVTSYYEDLEDVITWAKSQAWYIEPFFLAGHSLGGISIILYTEKHLKEIKGLAPISTVISGKLSLKSLKHRKMLDKWIKNGWREEKSKSSQSRIKRLPWSHMVDRLQYDVLPDAYKITIPVLLIVGENDESTPLEHQKLFFDRIQGEKELHIIKKAPHTFVNKNHLKKIKQLFINWIDRIG